MEERDQATTELAALTRAAGRFLQRALELGRPAGRQRAQARSEAPSAAVSRSKVTTSTVSAATPQPSSRPAPARPAAAPQRQSAPHSGPSSAPSPEPPTRARARAAATLAELEREVAACKACALCTGRTQTVFADGSPTAQVMFVGEGPGEEEDRTGVPFVGESGQLLTRIITGGMGLDRSRDVYIANVVKCRPPGNRDPSPQEKAMCTPFLERQIELVDPKVIITLGRHAAGHLLSSDAPMGRLRGQVVRRDGRAIVPTFHPAYLLRTPAKKKECWEDIQLAMGELGLTPPPR